GRAILNSANLEDGEGEGTRFDRVMSLAREYGAAVICLLIDEEGQARDVEWKLRVAHRIHDLAVNRYGLSPSDLIFDALTFPLSTGGEDLRGDGMATIEAIRRIKAELPGVYTVLGVSNVSFGLEADLDDALGSHSALEIVNDVLLAGMKVVGELFASGEMQLPFVLQSAECMKAAVAYLEPHMEKSDQGGKGRVVLGTVKGDV